MSRISPMRGPLISVIMPSFNSARTLSAAILGVLNQIYQNWELVIVDDGSDDDLASEIDQFDDTRIRLLRLEKNGGVAGALNAGLALAQGRYVARMDADDYMEDWRLGEQLRFLMLEGLALCGTGAQKFGDEHGVIDNPHRGADIIDAMFTGNPFVHPTMMFDRHRLGVGLVYDATLRCEEDYELWARIVTRDNCANMPGAALRYRVDAKGNANHPAKTRCNRLALARFAMRQGGGDVAPVADLNDMQMSGFVDRSGYERLRAYALQAAGRDWPRLGFLQQPLSTLSGYGAFVEWLDGHQTRVIQASRIDPEKAEYGKSVQIGFGARGSAS